MVDRKGMERYDELKRKRSVSEPNEKIIQNKHNDYDSKEEKIMPLVTSKEMLLKAQKGGYAVGAFNAENMEMVKADHPGS